MNQFFVPYIPGKYNPPRLPLDRHIPYVADGVIQSWLQDHVPANSMILDPICANPLVSLQAASAGYRVISVCNNPVLAFILETLSKAPQIPDFQLALSELLRTKIGNEHLDYHLKNLYDTDCPSCKQVIPVDYYLWRRGETTPYARHISCTNCGREDEYPLSEYDMQKLALPGSDRLHRARALMRVSTTATEESIPVGLKDGLNSYLPRPLYFIFTLLNKLEGLSLSADHCRILQALFLSVMDAGNTLWHADSGKNRPRQLITPPQFREYNLWRTLENAVLHWSSQEKPIPIVRYPQLPSFQGGICLYYGRLKKLVTSNDKNINPVALLTVFPRPSQVFWTYSALWSGWLWGVDAVAPMRGSLERQRYDWNWYTEALSEFFDLVSEYFSTEPRVFGVMPELESGFLNAAFVAAESSAYTLEKIAVRDSEQSAQLTWKKNNSKIRIAVSSPGNSTKKAVIEYLRQVNQPQPLLTLQVIANLTAVMDKSIPSNADQDPVKTLRNIQDLNREFFQDGDNIKRFPFNPQSREETKWWLNDPSLILEGLTLDDHIEMVFVSLLHKMGRTSLNNLDHVLCRRFPGLLTPSSDLLLNLAASYGQTIPGNRELIQLSSQEIPVSRVADLHNCSNALMKIGKAFGFSIQSDEKTILWINPDGEPEFCYYMMASSIISRVVYSFPPLSPSRCFIVLPGSRSNLLTYRLMRDPRLAEAVSLGWSFVKFRHLRRLESRSDLSLSNWAELLKEDPPQWKDITQESLFQ